jgi:hypothetical protein
MLLLVPSDPLRPRRPDPHFAPEAAAAPGLGFDVAVVDHDALTRPDGAAEAVRRVPGGATAIYRGWMLRPERYAAFAAALADRDVTLRTTPAAYRAAHELPGWYGAFRAHTPESVWTQSASLDELAALAAGLGTGAAVLRDHVKSAKHDWHGAAFIPDVTDEAAVRRVAARFLELRGEDLAGGLVLRRFEPFTGAEARTWWVDGACALVTAHPDTPGEVPEAGPGAFARAVRALGARFVTVDLALRADGVWRVVEAGDGQVSDRPGSTAPAELLRALSPALSP